ncbi:MAG: NYN domain-containing protein [Candidatus Vogelbacteria bacterium]|nr:NYN domain-containing protein [Candidatus Vogelbacteria bacterium]
MKERVCIFVDGGNFYHLALKKLKVRNKNFDFEKFVDFLVGNRIVAEMGKRYYTGTVREQENDLKSKEAMAEQTKLFSVLKAGHWEIKTSKLRRRLEEIIIDHRTVDCDKLKKAGFKKIQYERWREKGIDVKIATDLIVGAVDNKYDTAIIVR